MMRALILALAVVLPMLYPHVVWAQSDAEAALNKARTAFTNGDFAAARDLLTTAGQTAPDNPDIFLLLGKSHYQLGEIEPAMAAWRRTVRLAPAQTYAQEMLKALEGRGQDVDTALRVVRSLLDADLFDAAQQEIMSVRRRPLKPAQFAAALGLEAEVLIGQKKSNEALRLLRELATRSPEQADTARTRWLTGTAMLGLDAQSVARGLELLHGVSEEFGESSEGAAAALAVTVYRLQQGETVVEELAQWIADHKDHTEVRSARRAMAASIGVFLREAAKTATPAPDDGLSEADQSAMAAALHALPTLHPSDEAFQIVQQLCQHLQQRYVANGAFKTAETALAQLAALDLPAAGQAHVSAAREQVQIAEGKHQFDAIADRLALDPQDLGSLQTWIENHGNHPHLTDARNLLFKQQLAAAIRSGPAQPNTALTEHESGAIAILGQIIDKDPKSEKELVGKLLIHLHERYEKQNAFNAAAMGHERLLALKLAPSSRRMALGAMAEAQLQAAFTRIQHRVASGQPLPRQTPDDLARALAVLDTINQEFPAQPVWQRRIAAADQLQKIASGENWPARVTQIKSLHEWILHISLPVATAAPEPDLTAEAAASVHAIVTEVQSLSQPTAASLPVQVHARLLGAITEKHAIWPATMTRQIQLEMAESTNVFHQRNRTGLADANAALDDAQKQLLSRIVSLIQARPASADSILTELSTYLSTWIQAGHDEVVEKAYAALEPDLPPRQRRQSRLSIVQLWIDQALQRDQQLLDRGFQPPQELDENLSKALIRCYELLSDLPESDGLTAQAQQQRARVIDHYKHLKYDDVAAKAIAVKPEQAVAALDARAELELAELHWNAAVRELDAQHASFGGEEKVALTPAVEAVLTELQAFIEKRPQSTLVPQANQLMMAVGAKYEALARQQVAAEVYQTIEAFAAEHQPLAPEGKATMAERAAFAAAAALHVAATSDMQEDQEHLSAADQDAPEQLSKPFQEALAAYQAIVTKYADGAMAGPAIGKIMEIALQHANAGAWGVAADIYASLEELKLPLRRPERLELARALCQLGEVLPAHARQVLAAITLWEREAPVDNPPPGISQLAGMMEGGLGTEELAMGMGQGQLAAGAASEPADPAAAGPPAEQPAQAGEASASGSGPPGNGFGGGGQFADLERSRREVELLAAVRQQQAALTNRIAMLRDDAIRNLATDSNESEQAMQNLDQALLPAPVLSQAEIERQQLALSATYALLQAIRKSHPDSDSAEQARSEIMTIVNHWRSIKQWERAALLAKQYLADNPKDRQLPMVRMSIARDYLAWAAGANEGELTKQELLEQVGSRFNTAREELTNIIAAFPDNQGLRHEAQWDVANSHLTQARVIAGISRTLARGQFVRATNELLRTAEIYHHHPNIGQLPGMLWSISQELTSRGFFNEAITVWNKMTLHYPGHALAEQAALQIAETYRNRLGQPLRAAESYLELNFARGGDPALQDALFQIASQLTQEKRWVEALHVLETFVDSFPKHANAGQAVAMIGQVHQTNEVWEDAIDAYRRVIFEYDQGPWAQQSKWAIAECTINLSRWEEAQGAYREYQKDYPEDGKVAEATRRLEVLKNLARYQKVVDELGQRKAFDAQYQIATIVRSQLSNPVKAIIEYKKVAAKWPESHLADDALFQVGMIYLELHEMNRAREALLAAAEKYPASPLADDALFQVGASYEGDAQQLAGVTRGQSIQIAKDIAQKEAYRVSQSNRRSQRAKALDEISKLKQEGKELEAENKAAFQAARNLDFDRANAAVVANWAAQQEEALTTAQLADRQDKINASLRKAVAMFRRAASVASADKADDALLRMAQIYDQRLKDSEAAMATWLEIVKQYSGTTVAEDASWKIAQYYETHEKHAEAITAYKSFLRNYRRSPKASAAQAAIAENHEHLGNWVEAMDAYTNYINNYPEGDMVNRAKEQIAWIKTYRL